jgi:hypothetical protein
MALARPLATAGVLPAAVGAGWLVVEVRIVLAVVTTAQDGMPVDAAVSDVFPVPFFVIAVHVTLSQSLLCTTDALEMSLFSASPKRRRSPAASCCLASSWPRVLSSSVNPWACLVNSLISAARSRSFSV